MDVCLPEECRGQDCGTLERRISHVLHERPLCETQAFTF